MSTFQEVNDTSLIDLICKAKRRIVFVAPGVHQPVAEALGKRLTETENLQVTVVIDPDEDVCRNYSGTPYMGRHNEINRLQDPPKAVLRKSSCFFLNFNLNRRKIVFRCTTVGLQPIDFQSSSLQEGVPE